MASRTRLALASFLLAAVAGLYVAFAPLMTRCTFSSDGRAEPCTDLSLFETDGAWILVMVLVPIVIALVPLLVGRRPVTVVSAVLLWAICVIGILSVAVLFVPAAIAMTISATRRDPVPTSTIA